MEKERNEERNAGDNTRFTDLERCGPAVDLGLEKVNEMFLAHHGVMLEKVQGSCVLRKNRFHRRISSVVGCRPRFVLARPTGSRMDLGSADAGSAWRQSAT
ncbi:hypothetical protein EVAR_83673_1 [Eumeta japonica]|uniref:Uncharacterized protein n=1 Tax=Eumeta variegata TaxID=151549 RepID=A0A4C2A819_EUMVA|nr:hypothetical protein EVAR_83673_1 [Eumeta japonica]